MDGTFPLEEAAGRRFGPSQRALAQRRALWSAFKAALGALGVLAAWAAWPQGAAARGAAILALAALAWALWRWRGLAFLAPLAERELRLHAHAVELRRGDFKRFVVFEGLRHVSVVQAPGGGRLLSLRLDTDEDSVLLRDLDGLPEAFAAIAGAKPDHALIEIAERRVDWGEPLPWALALGAGALALGTLAFFF